MVSIMPGMEMAAPERTDTRRGRAGSPKRLFIARSTSPSARRTSSIKRSGKRLVLE